MTYDYNTAFDWALLDAYNAALRLGSQPRTTPEAETPPKERKHVRTKPKPIKEAA